MHSSPAKAENLQGCYHLLNVAIPVYPLLYANVVLLFKNICHALCTIVAVPVYPLLYADVVLLFRNICHGSDSVESAEKEIALWFRPEELVQWKPTQEKWIYE